MTQTQSPKRSARPYTAPRLIYPDAEGLSPEGKYNPIPTETPPTTGPS